jgi:hypothetical protein
MNTKTNDQKILELKNQITKKQIQINKALRFQPITNCSLEFQGTRYNIHAITKNQAEYLLLELGLRTEYIKKTNKLSEITISGYKYDDWLTDINAKLDLISVKEEENKLKEMETKLDRLLSNEKKVELEIDNIEKMLKEAE